MVDWIGVLYSLVISWFQMARKVDGNLWNDNRLDSCMAGLWTYGMSEWSVGWRLDGWMVGWLMVDGLEG